MIDSRSAHGKIQTKLIMKEQQDELDEDLQGSDDLYSLLIVADSQGEVEACLASSEVNITGHQANEFTVVMIVLEASGLYEQQDNAVEGGRGIVTFKSDGDEGEDELIGEDYGEQ
ncbi:MAG: hypothetical protein EZS28_013147 [Streblomastix strix]|uniref:Uncharacterized protein n=1 Tax=Streblomastix strix TaxID=222440 RepID=A0A5J4W8T9_9EUKA|nr:MAG: hypothetical protein EZS28_013147 [Streblomastix strix]